MDKKVLTPSYIFSQEKMLLDYAQNKLGIKPFSSAMDKAGHYLFFVLDLNGNLKGKSCTGYIKAYTLGTHKDGSVTDVQLGYAYFYKFYDNPLELKNLGVNLKYSGSGIGKLLLQAVENLAAANDLGSIQLRAILNKTRLNTSHYPEPSDFASKEEFTKALEKEFPPRDEDFFDKNYYFYYSQGYVHTELEYDGQEHKNSRPMLKSSLQHISLTKCLHRKIKPCKPTDELFKMTELHKNNCGTKDTQIYIETDQSKLDVTPFVIKQSEESLKNLQRILNQESEQE